MTGKQFMFEYNFRDTVRPVWIYLSMFLAILTQLLCAPLQALYIGSTLKVSLEQRHDLISTTFQRFQSQMAARSVLLSNSPSCFPQPKL